MSASIVITVEPEPTSAAFGDAYRTELGPETILLQEVIELSKRVLAMTCREFDLNPTDLFALCAVLIRGQLLYDNLHEVNDDPDNVKASQPKRFALWEVHPITEVYVCMTASKKCDPKKVKEPQWKRLENVSD